jgi:flagellar M-ring protein FliF
VKPVLDLVTKLGPARIAAMAAVTLTLIGFFAFIILRVSRPDMGVLFSDLSMQDSAAVVRELDSRGIRYETKGDAGQTIMAPRPDLAKLRMDLAGKGRCRAASATRSSTRATRSPPPTSCRT